MYLKVRMLIPNYTAYNKFFCSTLFDIKYLFNLVKDKELAGQYPPVINLALALVWRCWCFLLAYFGRQVDILCSVLLPVFALLHYCTSTDLLQGNFQHPQSQRFSVAFLCMRHYYIHVLIVLLYFMLWAFCLQSFSFLFFPPTLGSV